MAVMRDVYETLKRGAAEIAPKLEQANKLDDEIKSGRFSNDVNKEKLLEMQGIRGEIRRDAERIEDEANRHITAYIEQVQQANELRPEELTDDLKLLSAGVKLAERDIVAMLKRNKTNRTMQQIIFNYADEHGIGTGGFVYDNGLSSIPAAEGLRGTVRMYIDHWIDTDKAVEMLNKFFPGVGA